MRQPSIVIHKGRKEEKYEIYVEDYVLSFLKEKMGMSDAAEVFFYGRREKGGRRYTIYGAGQDRSLSVFEKYDMLEEISYRLTQTDPVFLVKEAADTYEVKGYKVFYYENEEMQDYLIHRSSFRDESFSDRKSITDRRTSERRVRQAVKEEVFRGKEGNRTSTVRYSVISLQLGFVFIVLVAIVINSANSYDKMNQLNQSAQEVFFVMENQEAEETFETKQNDIVVERDMLQGNTLQDSVLQENTLEGQTSESGKTGEKVEERLEEPTEDSEESPKDAQGVTEETGKDTDGTSETGETEAAVETKQKPGETSGAESQADRSGDQEDTVYDQKNNEQETTKDEEGVEALSRNVARYYEVERGDTLYMISQKIYGDTSHVKKICEMNEITDPDDIRYGQKIILP